MTVPRSEQFDDVYFSAEDGLAETTHVFLDGNSLAERWLKNQNDTNEFIIAETGFGTGLNFLAAWKLFKDQAPKSLSLHFISFEKYPLDVAAIKDALLTWEAELHTLTDELCAQYKPESGTIKFNDRVSLTLIIGDVNEDMPKAEFSADAWFLDGFRPSSNPEMWSETVFTEMARLSKSNATFATYTAAGFVRRGLESAGFTVEKHPGFGRKREMIVGQKKEA